MIIVRLSVMWDLPGGPHLNQALYIVQEKKKSNT